MRQIADIVVKNAFTKIKENKVTEKQLFDLARIYKRKPLTEEEIAKGREYIAKIQSGEMSFDEYWQIYKMKTGNI